MDQEQAGGILKKPALVEQLEQTTARMKMKSRAAISPRLMQRLEELRSPLSGGTGLQLGGLTSGFTRRLVQHNRSVFSSTRIFNPDLGSINPDIFPAFSSRIIKQFEGIRHLPAPARPAPARGPEWNQQIDMTLPGGSPAAGLMGMPAGPAGMVEKIKGPNMFSLEKPQATPSMFPSRFTGVDTENPQVRPPHMAPSPSVPRDDTPKKGEERKRIYRRIEYVGAPGKKAESPDVSSTPPGPPARKPDRPEPEKTELHPMLHPMLHPTRRSLQAPAVPEDEEPALPPRLPLDKREPLEVISPVRPRPLVDQQAPAGRPPPEKLPVEKTALPQEPAPEMPLRPVITQNQMVEEGTRETTPAEKKSVEAPAAAAKPIPVVKARLEPLRRVNPVAGLPPVVPLKSILPHRAGEPAPGVAPKTDANPHPETTSLTAAAPPAGTVQRLTGPEPTPLTLREPPAGPRLPGPRENAPLSEENFEHPLDLPLAVKPGLEEELPISMPAGVKTTVSMLDRSQPTGTVMPAGKETKPALPPAAVRPAETTTSGTAAVQRMPEEPAPGLEPVIPVRMEAGELEMPVAANRREPPADQALPQPAPLPVSASGQSTPAVQRLPEAAAGQEPLPAALPIPETGSAEKLDMPLAAPPFAVQREPEAGPVVSSSPVKPGPEPPARPAEPRAKAVSPSPAGRQPEISAGLTPSQPEAYPQEPLDMPVAAAQLPTIPLETARPGLPPLPIVTAPEGKTDRTPTPAAAEPLPVVKASPGAPETPPAMEMPVAAGRPQETMATQASPPIPPAGAVPQLAGRPSTPPGPAAGPADLRPENLRKPAEMPLRPLPRPAIIPSSQGIIQRVVSEEAENAPEQPELAPPPEQPPPPPDLAELARQIYPMLKRMLAIERERQSGRR